MLCFVDKKAHHISQVAKYGGLYFCFKNQLHSNSIHAYDSRQFTIVFDNQFTKPKGSIHFFLIYLKFPIVDETGSIIAKVSSYFLRIFSNSTIWCLLTTQIIISFSVWLYAPSP